MICDSVVNDNGVRVASEWVPLFDIRARRWVVGYLSESSTKANVHSPWQRMNPNSCFANSPCNMRLPSSWHWIYHAFWETSHATAQTVSLWVLHRDVQCASDQSSETCPQSSFRHSPSKYLSAFSIYLSNFRSISHHLAPVQQYRVFLGETRVVSVSKALAYNLS